MLSSFACLFVFALFCVLCRSETVLFFVHSGSVLVLLYLIICYVYSRKTGTPIRFIRRVSRPEGKSGLYLAPYPQIIDRQILWSLCRKLLCCGELHLYSNNDTDILGLYVIISIILTVLFLKYGAIPVLFAAMLLDILALSNPKYSHNVSLCMSFFIF